MMIYMLIAPVVVYTLKVVYDVKQSILMNDNTFKNGSNMKVNPAEVKLLEMVIAMKEALKKYESNLKDMSLNQLGKRLNEIKMVR